MLTTLLCLITTPRLATSDLQGENYILQSLFATAPPQVVAINKRSLVGFGFLMLVCCLVLSTMLIMTKRRLTAQGYVRLREALNRGCS